MEDAGEDEHADARREGRKHGRHERQACGPQQQPAAAHDVRDRTDKQLAEGHAHEEAGERELRDGLLDAELASDVRQDGQVHVSRKRRCCGQQRQGEHEGDGNHTSRFTKAATPPSHRMAAQSTKTTRYQCELSAKTDHEPAASVSHERSALNGEKCMSFSPTFGTN